MQKQKKEQTLWQAQIDSLKGREQELISQLFANEFQQLSDYEYQNILIAELKENGFEGYKTNNEIAVW